MAKNFFFISGNETPGIASVFTENLLFQRRRDDAIPLFIETRSVFFVTSALKKKHKDGALRALEYYADLGIASIPLEKIQELQSEAKKKELKHAEDEFADIFVYDDSDPSTLPLIALADYIILLLKNNVSSPGYVYKLMKMLSGKEIRKRVLVILSDVNRLEQAAAAFKRLAEELTHMLGGTQDVDFGGFFPLDAQYLAHAARVRRPCVQVFPDTAFHGAIKYVSRALDGLETYIRDTSVLAELARLPKIG